MKTFISELLISLSLGQLFWVVLVNVSVAELNSVNYEKLIALLWRSDLDTYLSPLWFLKEVE